MIGTRNNECVVFDGLLSTLTTDGRMVAENNESINDGISRRLALVELFSSRGEEVEANKVRMIIKKMFRLAEDVSEHRHA